MSTFSTTVTKAQRNARDFNTRGQEISICSRQHTKRPGYNPSPFQPKIVSVKLAVSLSCNWPKTIIKERENKKLATVQIRPNTKRGQRAVTPSSKDIKLPVIPIKAFLETTCELATPRDMFFAIHGLSHGQPCIGCAYDEHSKTGCPAKQKLLRERGLIT